ncbi:MAG: hypothetical protein ACXWG1_00760 [Usitatibacter sp.]
MKAIKAVVERLIPWLPFAFALFLSYSVTSHLGQDMRSWEPAFYSFLPMCFFFVGAGVQQMAREIRELRGTVAELQAQRTGSAAAG